jgi:hypothetical protein
LFGKIYKSTFGRIISHSLQALIGLLHPDLKIFNSFFASGVHNISGRADFSGVICIPAFLR